MRENLVRYLEQKIEASDSWTKQRRDELVGELRTTPALYRLVRRTKDGLLRIDKGAIASIKTSGIIGDKFVSIALGPSDSTLKDGDTIRQTESAFVLEDAIGQLINNSGSSGDSKEKSSNSDKEQKPGKSEK